MDASVPADRESVKNEPFCKTESPETSLGFSPHPL